jgi:hypothetical protein
MWDVIAEAVKRHLAPFVEGVWESVTFWRSLALVLLGLLAAAYFLRERIRELLLIPERVEHDRHIFDRADEIMAEASLYRCLDGANAHDYRPDERIPLLNFLQYFGHAGNQFLNRRICRALDPLIKALVDLREFTNWHFFDVHHDGHVYALYPELRDEPGEPGERYRQHATELEKLVDRVEELYPKYRQAVKRYLLK